MRIRAFLGVGLIAAFTFACSDSDSGGQASVLSPEGEPVASFSTTPSPSAIGPAPADVLEDVATPGGFTVEPLVRAGFLDDITTMVKIKLDGLSTNVVNVPDPSDAIFAKLTFDEGGSVGWHTHPGPALVAVQSGTIGIINANDCVLRHYPAGTAFIDPGQGNVHVGFNAAAGQTVAYVVFLDVPPGQGPTIPAPAPNC